MSKLRFSIAACIVLLAAAPAAAQQKSEGKSRGSLSAKCNNLVKESYGRGAQERVKREAYYRCMANGGKLD